MDAVNVALQVAFILIFVVVLVRYLRQPREVHRDLVLVFGCVVALFAIQIATRLLPTLPRGISQLSTVILLLQPFLTLRLAGHFVPVSRQVAGVALAWFATAVVAVIIGTRGNPALTLFVVAYFVAVEGIAAAFLLRSSRYRVGYARTRLRIASAATFLFAAGIFVAGAGSAAATGGATADPSILVLARLLTLAAGIGYLAAFLPPMALRRLQQRAVAFDLGQTLLGSPLDGDQDRIWVALAQSARMVTNGSASVVALGEPSIVRIVSGEPPGGIAVGQPYLGPTGNDIHGGARTTITVPIESELGPAGLADRLPGRRLAVPRRRCRPPRAAVGPGGTGQRAPRGDPPAGRAGQRARGCEPGACDLARPARERGPVPGRARGASRGSCS